MNGFRLTLAEASQNAKDVDLAFLSVFILSAIIFLGLFILLVVFAVRYRKGSRARRGPLPQLLQSEFEMGWTIATVFIAIFIYWWFIGGAKYSLNNPSEELEVHVVAKQWMWKTQHADGVREINALHLPVNVPARLTMISEDVIHSFYVPAFRLKQDVLPGRRTSLSFTPTQIGTFELLCAEYCGTQHSHMIGSVIVMRQNDYARWLEKQPRGNSLAQTGGGLFSTLGCAACHASLSRERAPQLANLYGTVVTLSDGRKVVANDAYLIKSIERPGDDVVKGFAATMPSYAQTLKSPDVDALVAYIKSLSAGKGRHD